MKKILIALITSALLLTSCNNPPDKTSSVAESSSTGISSTFSASAELKEPDSDRELIKKAVALFDDDRKLIYNDAEKLVEEYPDLIINTGNTGGPSFNFGGKKAYWLCPPYNAELMNRERFEAFINNYQNRTADMIYILSPSGTAVVDYSGETDRYTVAVYKVKDGEVLLLNVSRFALYETDRSYYITDNSDSLIVLPKDKNYKPVAVSDKALSDIEIADRLSELIGSERKFHFEEETEINGELCKCFVSGENTESYVIYAVSPDLKKIYRGGFPDGNWWLIAE